MVGSAVASLTAEPGFWHYMTNSFSQPASLFTQCMVETPRFVRQHHLNPHHLDVLLAPWELLIMNHPYLKVFTATWAKFCNILHITKTARVQEGGPSPLLRRREPKHWPLQQHIIRMSELIKATRCTQDDKGFQEV